MPLALFTLFYITRCNMQNNTSDLHCNDKNEEVKIKAALVGISGMGITEDECEKSLLELERLLDTSGGECVVKLTQAKDSFDARTAIGSGKVKLLKESCDFCGVELVVFDVDLSPSQIRNLEEALDGPEVIDRSMLILDIFAQHARSKEGKLQVELAQLKYTAPRLIGKGKEMSRLGAGIGSRGPGESQLETDKRHLQRRIYALETQLKEIEKNRNTMRSSRDRKGIFKIAIVGYTNAGKSTLMNKLTDADVLCENKLFATLDPTTRRLLLPCGEEVLISDTVGFIKRLPHHLIKAFKSTLDETLYADLVLNVVDSSDPECISELECTESTLEELGAGGKDTIYVFNKSDATLSAVTFAHVRDMRCVSISAKTGVGIDKLIKEIETVYNNGKKKVIFTFPLSKQADVSRLYGYCSVEIVEYGSSDIKVYAVADQKCRGMFSQYLPKEDRPQIEDEEL